MHKTTNVAVLSNILRLGIEEPADAFSVLRKWRRTQNVTKDVLIKRSANHLKWELHGKLPDNMGDHLFVSFHYGLWYFALAALHAHAPDRRIYCLISRQDDNHAQRLLEIARAAQIEIVFIQGGVSMVRGALKAKAEGAILFVLIDVPWGLSSETDRQFPLMNGDIQAKSALFKFAERLQLQPRLLVTDFDERTRVTHVIDHGTCDQDQCFRIFDQCVSEKPHLWDRLFDVHKYYAARNTPDRYFPFRLDGSYYVINMASMRTYRVTRRFFEDSRQLKNLVEQGIRDEADKLRRDIHARTNLHLGAVF